MIKLAAFLSLEEQFLLSLIWNFRSRGQLIEKNQSGILGKLYAWSLSDLSYIIIGVGENVVNL